MKKKRYQQLTSREKDLHYLNSIVSGDGVLLLDSDLCYAALQPAKGVYRRDFGLELVVRLGRKLLSDQPVIDLETVLPVTVDKSNKSCIRLKVHSARLGDHLTDVIKRFTPITYYVWLNRLIYILSRWEDISEIEIHTDNGISVDCDSRNLIPELPLKRNDM